MRTLPALAGRAVIAVLERAGFKVMRTKGSHISCGIALIPTRQTVAAVHRSDLPPGTVRAILRQAHLSRAKFLDLL